MACSSQLVPLIRPAGSGFMQQCSRVHSQSEGLRQVSFVRESDSRDLHLSAHLEHKGASRRPSTTSCSAGVVEAAPAQEEAPAGTSDPDATLAAKPKWGGGGGGRQRVKARQNKTQANSEMVAGPKLQWLQQDGVDLTSECMVPEDEMCGRASAGLVSVQRAVWRVNRAIARCTSVREALQVVEEMKAAGLNAANEGTYVALITVCRRQRQGERALVVYEAMKASGVRPSLLTFNTLISCCQQAQRLEDAFQLKVDMEKCSVKPDVVTYTSLMALLVKAGPYRGRSSPAQRLGKAMDLYREMQQREVKPDAQTFNTLMYASAQAKLPGKVLEVYGMMSASGVVPNHFTFGILLEAVGQGGRLKQALEILNEMKAAGVAPQTSTYNAILEACATAPQPADLAIVTHVLGGVQAAKAWSLFEEMKSYPTLTPNAETLSHLITASCKGGDHAGALKAFAMMTEEGFSSSITASVYNKLIHSASKGGSLEEAFEIYSKMKSSGIPPDRVTYGTLVSACKEGGEVGRVLEVHKEMQDLGLKPDQVVYHALMGAYGEAGRWEEAIAAMEEMRRKVPEEGIQLGSYSIAFDACFGREGAVEAVAKAASSGRRLEMTAGVKAALELYEEGVQSGVFKNFSATELTRCDVRQMTRSGVVVCLLSWVEYLRVRPVTTDIVLVTGSDKGRGVQGPKKGRFPKLFVTAENTFKAMGLKSKTLRTLTMQALTVEEEELQSWLETNTEPALRLEAVPQLSL